MLAIVVVSAATAIAGAILPAEEAAPCEPGWTFPVPFFQSVAWSPDGRRLAVAAVLESWDEGYGVYLVEADGSALERLPTGGDRDLFPVFSPDGRRIAFQSRRDGNSDVWSVAVDGTDLVRLTDDPASDGYPSYSPDGRRIVFHSDRAGSYDLWLMNADGSDPRRLTDHPADDYNPAWSPDGSRIAFDSDRDEVEGDEIWAVAPDGTGLERLAAAGVFPAWSPDGTVLLYAKDALYRLELGNGEAPRQLLPDAVFAAFSPDGKTVAAAETTLDADCQDHHALVTLDPDGRGRRQLLP